MHAHALAIVGTYGRRDRELFSRYREMFFMEDESRKPRNSGVDDKDWAITVSPSARNEVTGMVRLLDTSELHIKINDGGKESQNADQIEAGLKAILRVSGETRRARIESDSALSAVLFGPVVLYFESVDDLIAVTDDKYKKLKLEEIRKRTPILIRTIPADQSYPEWGEFSLLSHTWKYVVKGGVLRERWGVKDAKPNQDYTVYDTYDCENRLVKIDGMGGKGGTTVFAAPHGLAEIPVTVRYAGGTSLFNEPEKQLNSFLYAKAKSRLDKRENAALTNMATAINMRGIPGPLLAVDPDTTNDTVEINYQGGVRILKAKAQLIEDKLDPTVFQWLQKLDEISGQSTIYKQTLGENLAGSTFSGLAMLSSAGKLPMVDAQRGIEMAFRDVFLGALRRIKDSGIDNTLIPPNEIPDDIEIEVSLEPKLPQDQLRNAQVAQSISGLVSHQWIHTNLLQISDSNEMERQITKDAIKQAILQNILSNPQTIQPFVQAAMGMPPQQPQQPQQPPQQPGMEGQVPPEMMGPEGQPPAMPQQGMEQLPMGDAMIPPQERM
jgi:hypothetical protein